MVESNTEGKLTPYQGSNRCYGFFECSSCNKKWESGNSWANTYQECQRCKIKIYPYKQSALEKPKEDEVRLPDNNKDHP